MSAAVEPWRCDERAAEIHRVLAAADGEAAERGRRWLAVVDLDRLGPAPGQLLPQLYLRLRDLAVEHPQMARLRGVHRQHWYRAQIQLAAVRPAIDDLVRAGVAVAPLGSLALTPYYDDDPGARPMAYAEMLVDPSQLGAAAQVLARSGWTALDRQAETLAGAYAAARASHPFRSAEGFELRLHWRLFDWGIAPRHPADLLRREEGRPSGGEDPAALSPEDLLLWVCALDPTRQPAAPLWVGDAVRLVRGAPLDWDRFSRRARQCAVAANAARSLDLVVEVCGAAVPEKVRAEMRTAPRELDLATARLHRSGAVVGPKAYRLARLVARRRLAPGSGSLSTYLGAVWGVAGRREFMKAILHRATHGARGTIPR